MSEIAASGQSIVMLAAENDQLPGGKVGGIGDVIRDVPAALAARGKTVSVLMPAYGVFHELPGAVRTTTIDAPFRGAYEPVVLYEVLRDHQPGVRTWVMEHPEFSSGGRGRIYCNDPADAPFASDASKFALFCSAAVRAIASGQLGRVDAMHLHDWHTAFAAILRAFDDEVAALRHLPCAFSIHNLAIQGIRPLRGSQSSLEAWYPGLQYDQSALDDPRWPACVNPLAAAIRLCDQVHTVSPSYSLEILHPSRVQQDGFYGGEGLEHDLQRAREQHRLHGILNGCDYNTPMPVAIEWQALRRELRQQLRQWVAASPTVMTADYLALDNLRELSGGPMPKTLVTSIGRLTEQKARLLTWTDSNGDSALDRLLSHLGDTGVMVIIGSGSAEYEDFLNRAQSSHSNLIFINHYAQGLADLLYASGDLFLMPSSFEPCGISQMLAMRSGQPCLVHAVGGLRDTVTDNHNGFHFSGATAAEQAERLVQRFTEAVELHQNDADAWEQMRNNARQARFLWSDAVEQYERLLYRVDLSEQAY